MSRKRRPAPSQEEIKVAIEAAREGKGRALAVMLKSFSDDDLAKAFSRGNVRATAPLFDPYAAISCALSFAAGMKKFRDDLNARLREVDKQVRREFKAKR
jgi:uncharacterized protein (DUF2236 family)